MIRLLDINVLLAIVWPQHIHHPRAHEWLAAEMKRGKLQIATSPITQLGFVRISLNIKGYAQNFTDAVELLDLLINRPELHHVFWPDSTALASLKPPSGAPAQVQPGQLTDLYLAGLARAHGGRLTTFDAGIKDSAVELIA